MFSPALVDKGVKFSAVSAAGCCFCWSSCPFAVISDSGRYFEISFSVIPSHVEKDPSLIAWSRVRLVGQQRILWQKLLILAGMFGNMLWGAMAPLVYRGCIGVAPELFRVCCSGMDDEQGITIIHLLVPDRLQ